MNLNLQTFVFTRDMCLMPVRPLPLFWPREYYFVRRTNHEAPHYSVFSNVLLPPPPPKPQTVSLSTLLATALSLCCPMNVRGQFQSHIKQQATL
jgi:hypothetical protein